MVMGGLGARVEGVAENLRCGVEGRSTDGKGVRTVTWVQTPSASVIRSPLMLPGHCTLGLPSLPPRVYLIAGLGKRVCVLIPFLPEWHSEAGALMK